MTSSLTENSFNKKTNLNSKSKSNNTSSNDSGNNKTTTNNNNRYNNNKSSHKNSENIQNRNNIKNNCIDNKKTKNKNNLNEIEENNDYNDNNNIIKLSLRKPKRWNWELTTSKSSPNISFPKILLYNDKGKLLAETNESDCMFRGNSNENLTKFTKLNENLKRTKSMRNDIENENKVNIIQNKNLYSVQNENSNLRSNSLNENYKNDSIKRPNRSKSANLYDMQEANIFLNKFVNQLKTKGIKDVQIHHKNSPESSLGRVYYENGYNYGSPTRSPHRNLKNSKDILPPVDENKTLKTRSNLDSKFSIKNEPRNYGLGKSQSAVEIQNQKSRKSHRINSTNSGKLSSSFLERKAAYARCSSSSSISSSASTSQFIESENLSSNKNIIEIGDLENDQNGYDQTKYKLRTSKAGTLIVCEESFRNRKVRRRPRSCYRYNDSNDDIIECKETIKTEYEYLGEPNSSNKFINSVDLDNDQYDDDTDCEQLITEIHSPIHEKSPSIKYIKKSKTYGNFSSCDNFIPINNKSNNHQINLKKNSSLNRVQSFKDYCVLNSKRTTSPMRIIRKRSTSPSVSKEFEKRIAFKEHQQRIRNLRHNRNSLKNYLNLNEVQEIQTYNVQSPSSLSSSLSSLDDDISNKTKEKINENSEYNMKRFSGCDSFNLKKNFESSRGRHWIRNRDLINKRNGNSDRLHQPNEKYKTDRFISHGDQSKNLLKN